MLIAIPVFRVSCKVAIDRGRTWSVVDELVLWAITRQSRTIGALASESGLPRQLVVSSIARLMRFRLVEVVPMEGGAAFRASEFGFEAISSGNPLPFFPTRYSRRVSFVVERVTGRLFLTRDVRVMAPPRLERERESGTEIRTVLVKDGGPSVSHEANFNRLSDIAARGWDEQIAFVDGRTASLHDEFMVVRVVDGVPRGLPGDAGKALQKLVAQVAALPRGTGELSVPYAGPRDAIDVEPVLHSCTFDSGDLIIGGSVQRRCLLDLLETAHRRVIIHSTFLDPTRFQDLFDPIRAACQQGVVFDLLWGAESDEETEQRNGAAAAEIARLVRQDRDTNGRFHVHMRSTASHAKLVLLDTAEGGWIAGVGSCNWLSSPFQSVELSVVLRAPAVVAEVAVALQRLVGQRGLSDEIATEMAVVARDLRRVSSTGGPARVAVVVGEAHDQLLRAASGAARRRIVIGSNRLGSTARPGALMPGEVAASRSGVTATVLYTQASGPLKNRHARALAADAAENGVRLTRTRKIPLHGKFVAWDDDDLVVTSLNWASASADPDFPLGEVGVHIHAPGIAANALSRLGAIFPELGEDLARAGA